MQKQKKKGLDTLSDAFRGSSDECRENNQIQNLVQKNIINKALISYEEGRKKVGFIGRLIAFGVGPAAARNSGCMLLLRCRVFMSPFDLITLQEIGRAHV